MGRANASGWTGPGGTLSSAAVGVFPTERNSKKSPAFEGCVEHLKSMTPGILQLSIMEGVVDQLQSIKALRKSTEVAETVLCCPACIWARGVQGRASLPAVACIRLRRLSDGCLSEERRLQSLLHLFPHGRSNPKRDWQLVEVGGIVLMTVAAI